MKKNNLILLAIVLFTLLGISACAPKRQKSAPSMSAPAPVSISAPRYAHIEESFEIIAESIDPEEVISNVQEVLEMCESGDASMLVYKRVAETNLTYFDSTVRFYMEVLPQMGRYDARINNVDYNEEGKITRIVQTIE